ncbi:MAG TPA: hypothetical protein VJQ25_08175, partial [Nitrospira sp.]|nr:hypothetical protein [Nitrospira sp.]
IGAPLIASSRTSEIVNTLHLLHEERKGKAGEACIEANRRACGNQILFMERTHRKECWKNIGK